ncbi:GTP-binding protein [Halomonas sp. 18H]|uniref:CobW family GTP-binding protein n=1 Tax=Halomonas almeriensis TaxID=308163 RepID=UPI0022315C8B|nr:MULTISPECIES: GTP-binding protein [Halomonas]MCW4149220.1 GTP-binding protein [Halomonas sp. 18H]MDN3552230.1 GTP-binding protein [Halomonas almeriensis]
MTRDDAAIPVTVIGGFLGAGKTTYLNGLIATGLPDDSLLIVNDFGDINIDAELIDYRSDRVLELSNGCICCTLGGTLAERLAEALRWWRCLGAVFIEASGVADPARIADLARVSRRLVLEDVVCVVDASQADSHAADPLIGDLRGAQLAAATRVLLNRVPGGECHRDETLYACLTRLAPGVEPEIMPAPPGREEHAAPRISSRQAITLPAEAAGMARHAGAWVSATVTLADPVDPDWLAAVFLEHADALVRAKGFAERRDRAGVQIVPFSGGRLGWQPAFRVPPRCQLVCIGRRGPGSTALLEALRQASVVSRAYRLGDERREALDARFDS